MSEKIEEEAYFEEILYCLLEQGYLDEIIKELKEGEKEK